MAEKFRLHFSPDRFDHLAVIAVTNQSQAEFEPVVTHVAREHPIYLMGTVIDINSGFTRLDFVAAALVCAEFTYVASAIRSIDYPGAQRQ